MAGFRSYYPVGDLQAGALASLDAAESRHLTKALRARPGDAVTLFNGTGAAWEGVLESTGRETTVRIESLLDIPSPQAQVTLAVAMLKGKAMDAVIKAAVELGAWQVVPLETAHTEVRLSGERAEGKREHWQTVANEAMKQSGNLAGLAVQSPQPLEKWLVGEYAFGARLVASLEPDAAPILRCVPPGAKSVVILIGPEGDFSPSEYAAIAGAGYTPASLGPHVLRAETACASALSAVLAHLAVGQ
ncbi:MAG: RsmE family RNA methyltransferase [Puniceicoccales bacterium]